MVCVLFVCIEVKSWVFGCAVVLIIVSPASHASCFVKSIGVNDCECGGVCLGE